MKCVAQLGSLPQDMMNMGAIPDAIFLLDECYQLIGAIGEYVESLSSGDSENFGKGPSEVGGQASDLYCAANLQGHAKKANVFVGDYIPSKNHANARRQFCSYFRSIHEMSVQSDCHDDDQHSDGVQQQSVFRQRRSEITMRTGVAADPVVQSPSLNDTRGIQDYGRLFQWGFHI
jgi:hypothetical protein